MNADTERTVILACYILHLIGAITALPSVIGLVLNYVRRAEAGDLLGSHHRWMIRSFWWAVLWLIIGYLTLILLIGWPIIGLAWLWYVYRHVRGLINLVNGQPMPG